MIHSSIRIGLIVTAWVLESVCAQTTANPTRRPTRSTRPAPNVEINVHKGKTKSKTSTTGRQETYEFTVTIKNLDGIHGHREMKAELFAIGENRSDHSMYNVIATKTSSFDLARGAEHAFKSDFFYVKYYSGSGMTLGGYLVLVYDRNGTLVKSKATKSSFEKGIKTIRAAEISKSSSKSFRLK